MTDDEFAQAEIAFRDALETFKAACEENGFDAECRIEDAMYDAGLLNHDGGEK